MLCLDYHTVVNKTTLACTVAKHCNTVFIDVVVSIDDEHQWIKVANSSKIGNFFLLRMWLVYLLHPKQKKKTVREEEYGEEECLAMARNIL